MGTPMKQFIQKNRKWFGYVLYAVLITAGLLYFRFPAEAIKDYLETKGERSNAPYSLSIGQVSPSLPFGLKLLETQVSQSANPNKIIFQADRLSIRPTIRTLLRGKLKFCFEGLAYDGVLRGCADFSEKKLQAPLSASISLDQVHMGQFDFPRLIGRHVEGSLDGTLTYNGRSNFLIEGSGEADLRLSDGRLELLQPILSLDSIDFNQVTVKMALQNQKINLTQVALEGPQMRGTLSGIITLRKEIGKSRLDLRGTIEPYSDFFKSLPGTLDIVKLFKRRLKRGTLSFIVRGTLTEPSIQFT
jgi:type II secretion system protein N